MNNLVVHRTSNSYSLSSNEFEVSYPDGYIGKIWSPPWHELSPEEEELKAKEYALNLYIEGKHTYEI